MSEKVLVAMSGGVDSSAAALILKNSGYDVSGMMLRLFATEEAPLGELPNEKDAKSVCDRLEIPFFVCDYQKEFRDMVIGDFISAYEKGKTPNPCVVCNKNVKFEFMLKEAKRLGIEKIATGHYAIVEHDEKSNRYIIRKGADKAKDQSYMLSLLTQEQLSRVLFPLGRLTKPEIRELAKKNGFVSADKKDSQDICFIPNGNYTSFIESTTKKVYAPGNFVDTSGNILGRHKGLIRYTTGQRKGLGLALPAPMYVLDKDVESNTVVLGTNDMLFGNECIVKNVNAVFIEGFCEPIRASVKVRYSHSEAPAWIYPIDNLRAKVVFDSPQRAITRGQTAAFYDDDILLGGGTIE